MKEASISIGRIFGGLGLIIIGLFLVPSLVIPALCWKVWVSITDERRNAREIMNGTTIFFTAIAISIDKFGNCAYGGFLSDILLKDGVYKFGNTQETISEVLGWGYYYGDLNKYGLWLHNTLNWLEENHCEKARLHGLMFAKQKAELYKDNIT